MPQQYTQYSGTLPWINILAEASFPPAIHPENDRLDTTKELQNNVRCTKRKADK